MHLQFYYQNCRGLRTKTLHLFTSSLLCAHGITFLTETWVNESIYSSELFCDSYDIIRCDRDSINTAKVTGGGVLLVIKKEHIHIWI